MNYYEHIKQISDGLQLIASDLSMLEARIAILEEEQSINDDFLSDLETIIQAKKNKSNFKR